MSKGRNVQNVKFSVQLPGDDTRETHGFTLVDSRSRNVAILVHQGTPLSRKEAKEEKNASVDNISLFEVLPRDDLKKKTKKGASPIYLRTLSEPKDDGRVVHRALNTAVSKIIYGDAVPEDAESRVIKFTNFAGETTEIPVYDKTVREVVNERASKKKSRKKTAAPKKKKRKAEADVEEEDDDDEDSDDGMAAIKELQAQIKAAKAAKRKKQQAKKKAKIAAAAEEAASSSMSE